jgi:hypothetical protein
MNRRIASVSSRTERKLPRRVAWRMMMSTNARLREFADAFTALRWAAFLLDSEWRLVWVSDELKEFIRAAPESDLGYGLHMAEALLKDPWVSGMHPSSLAQILSDTGAHLVYDLVQKGRDPQEVIPGEIAGYLEGVEPIEPPRIIRTSFEAVDPADPELPPYPVNACAIKIAGDDGLVGWAVIMFMNVRPNLLTLLARGDEDMYERMARLVDPGPRQAAILF